MKAILTAVSLLLFIVSADISFSAHHEEKAVAKGTVTKIEISEYEVTIKDDKGTETKNKVKDISDIKVGDSVIIKEGKIKKAVKPVTGGY
jgi:sRNA-binding protein